MRIGTGGLKKTALTVASAASAPDKVEVLPDDETTVKITGRKRDELVAEILGDVREITLPDFVDGQFSFGEWKALYANRVTLSPVLADQPVPLARFRDVARVPDAGRAATDEAAADNLQYPHGSGTIARSR